MGILQTLVQRLTSCDMEVVNFKGYNHSVVTVLERVISLGYIVMYLQKRPQESKDSFQNNHKWEKIKQYWLFVQGLDGNSISCMICSTLAYISKYP